MCSCPGRGWNAGHTEHLLGLRTASSLAFGGGLGGHGPEGGRAAGRGARMKAVRSRNWWDGVGAGGRGGAIASAVLPSVFWVRRASCWLRAQGTGGPKGRGSPQALRSLKDRSFPPVGCSPQQTEIPTLSSGHRKFPGCPGPHTRLKGAQPRHGTRCQGRGCQLSWKTATGWGAPCTGPA